MQLPRDPKIRVVLEESAADWLLIEANWFEMRAAMHRAAIEQAQKGVSDVSR